MKTIKVGIVGDFQSGKSTLINCLFGRSIASVGDGTATTHTAVNYRYSEKESIQYVTEGKKFEAKVEDLCLFDSTNEVSEITVFVKSQILKDFTLKRKLIIRCWKTFPRRSFLWNCTRRRPRKNWQWAICWTAASAPCGVPTPMSLPPTSG